MPLITTHNYFAKDVLKRSKKEITNAFKEKQNLYELFAQGFDPFIFYEFFKLKKNDLQEYCHYNDTDTFFLNFIKRIKEKNFQNNPTILASLYGHLTHYTLDSTTHPYIIYKTGEYKKEKPETLKYNGLHNKMEMAIDAYFYEQKEHKLFKNFKIHKHLITKEKFDKDLLNLLNEVYEETFPIPKGGDKYQKGCRNMYYAYKFLIVDQTGIKKIFYRLFDKMTPKKKGVYENFSSHITNIDNIILNNKHQVWYNPWNKEPSTESFFDLYNKALKNCIVLFEATHNFLEDKITEEEYKNVLKDKSYVTGLSWHIKEDMKYLEF